MSVSIEQIISYADSLGMPEDLLPDLAVIVVEQLPQQLASIQAALDAGDVTQVMKAAHTYKGSVGTFTDQQIWELSKSLELGARQNQPIEELAQLFTGLPALHADFLTVMQVLVSRGG